MSSMSHPEQSSVNKEPQKTIDNAPLNMKSISAKTKTKTKNRAGEIIVQTIQKVESAESLYNRNSVAIKSASDAIANFSQDHFMEGAPGELLSVAKKMVNALDVVKGIHPFVGVAVVAFQAIVKLEIQRRENDDRVSSTLCKASEMMSVLLELGGVNDQSTTELNGEETKRRLQGILKGIEQDLQTCGVVIHKYWQSKFVVKFFLAEQFANKFRDIWKGFAMRKDDLAFALQIRTALKVDIVVDKLEQLIQMQTEREAMFAKAVKLQGGREKCMENQDLLKKLLLATSDQWEQDKSRPDCSSNDAMPNFKEGDEKNRLDKVSLLFHELHANFEDLLEENRASFMLAYDKQTSRIMSGIKSSEARIIRTINNNNIFQQVKDPHLQYIWKQMKWRTNVKTQHFIAELHDYFMNRFSNLHHGSGTAHEQAVLLPPRDTSDSDSSSDSEVEDHKLPAVDPKDEWCLKYLTILYVPSLSEGIDSDANRLVNIREVNAFTATIPLDWSLLQALAYWAAGWWVDSKHYCTCIRDVLKCMVSVQKDALPENRSCIVRYLDSYPVHNMTQLIRSLQDAISDDDSDLDLADLSTRHRKAQEEEMAKKLDSVKYEIDSMDSIKLIGSGRIENFLLPLLYLIVKRHLQIMKLAGTVILMERELEYAAESIRNITEAVDIRMYQLAEIFQKQGTDPKVKFTWYAHGLYNVWYTLDHDPSAKSEPWVYSGLQSNETKLEIDTSALKFHPLSLPEIGEQLDKPVQLVAWNSGQEPQDGNLKEEFIRLWCLNELHKNCWSSNSLSRLSSDEKRRFDLLAGELPPPDVERWSSVAELHLRKRTMGPIFCDACRLQILDVWNHCLDCKSDDYDLCSQCEALPTPSHKSSDHKATHNILVFRIVRPRFLRMQAKECVAHILSASESLLDAEGSLTTEVDKSTTKPEGSPLDTETSIVNDNVCTCAECGAQLKGVFYLCIVCQESEKRVTMCHDCAFCDTFNVIKEHDETHHLLKIKNKVQDTDGTLEKELSAESKETDEAGALAALSLRVDNLAAIVESQDRRLSELMEKLHLLLGVSV